MEGRGQGSPGRDGRARTQTHVSVGPRRLRTSQANPVVPNLEEPGLAFYVIQFTSGEDMFGSSCAVPGPVLGPGDGGDDESDRSHPKELAHTVVGEADE